MDSDPIQGGVAILQGIPHAKETGISSGLWLVCAFTFLFYLVHTAVHGCQTSLIRNDKKFFTTVETR